MLNILDNIRNEYLMQLYFFYSILFHIIYSLRGRPRPCRENFIVKSFPVANTVHLGEKKKEG